MADSMSITELAARVGMTVRNIRAYQSKGLLFPPEIRGRVAHYSGAHAARLELIASLQREGFSLSAVKRLVEDPAGYGAIVSNRRQRFHDGTSDISRSVPIPEARIHELLPDLPSDLTESGLAWRDENGDLVSHTVLVSVGRMLAAHGLPLAVIAALQLDAAACARALGEEVRAALSAESAEEDRSYHLARIAMQLSATAFEIGFLVGAAPDAPAGTA